LGISACRHDGAAAWVARRRPYRQPSC
jgi:hypothetical protein